MLLYAIKHALRGISRRKMKNIINMLGILIGVSLLAGVQIATDSLVNAMQETVSLRYGNADITIQKGEFTPDFFNYSVYEQLRNDPVLAPHIDAISPRINSQISATSIFTTKQTEPFVTVIGINETIDNSFGELVPDDTYGNNEFNFSDITEYQCIIGSRLAESLIDFDVRQDGREEKMYLPTRAKPIEMSYIDAQGNVRLLESVNVQGIAKTEGKGVLNTGLTIFLKLEYLQRYFNTTNTGINNIIVSTTLGNDNAVNVKKLCEERLQFYLGEEDGGRFQVYAQKYEAFEDVADSIGDFRVVLYVFGSLIIISGIMLILNITLMNIDERQRSIGIMRAIGMTKTQLLVSLLTESFVLGGLGSLLGLLGGVVNGLGIIALLENFLDIGNILTDIPLIVKPVGLVVSFVIGLLISLLAAIYPALRAARLDIVQTINEIETPQLRRRSGNWSILVGVNMIVGAIAAFAISLVITSDWRWMMFVISILVFLFGLGFTFARIIGTRISFNAFAISWMITGLLCVLLLNPYLNTIEVGQEWGMYTFLASMLALVFGTIIFIALNLEWISNQFNNVFQKFRRMRSMGIISMRYVGKKKTRSALTFAIFGVILTMNVFLSVFTGSFTLGFDDFAAKEEGGVDIIAYSPFGSVSFEEDPIDIIKNADPNVQQVVGMKFKFSLAGAYTYLNFIATNETHETVEEIPVPTDMWGINEDFLDMTEYKFTEVWEDLDEDPWGAAKNGVNRFIILPNLLKQVGFDEGGKVYWLALELGDTVTIPEYDPVNETTVLGNYTLIAFIETTSYSMLFSSFLFTGEDSPIFGDVRNNSAYLIQTDSSLTTEENVEVSRNIEAELFGFDTLCLRDRMESLMEFIIQSVSFMQAFVSLGLVVGVLGLIVVSLRGITERTREIGMMRALGFHRAEVITTVVVEIFMVAFVGLIIGLVNGFILGYGMYTQYLIEYDFKFIIPWAMLGIFTAITIVLSIVAAVIPARRASKIPPSDALRYTG